MRGRAPIPLELHRLLAFAGAALLVATFVINTDHAESGAPGAFNYAYVTGISMLAAFVASFAVFTKQKMRRGFAT